MSHIFSYAEHYMDLAIKESEKAIIEKEVPVGCVIVFENKVISSSFNHTIQERNPLSHAEMIAIQKASKILGDWRLTECDLFVTIEPCIMCFGAIHISRIRSLYYGASNKITGVFSGPTSLSKEKLKTLIFHGILEDRIEKTMKDFFVAKRRGG